jgi:membrane-associated protease RseP (regulator of RpoE activity)
MLSKHAPGLVAQSQLQFNSPLLFRMASWLIPSLQHPMNEIAFHPLAFAAWIGMFMTALNLLPGGQLDGGHIVYALWPRWHRLITRATIAVLVPLGIFYFYAWLIWAGVLLAFSRHPKVSESPSLGHKRIGLAVLALCMFALAFHFNPIVLVNEPTIWEQLVGLAHRGS